MSQAPHPRVAVVHGPNLNLLGRREPEIYGHESLVDINRRLSEEGRQLGVALSIFQSNHEGELVEHLQSLHGRCEGLLINAAGLTHTSVILRDAVSFLNIPTVEVHLSNVHAREPFRHRSMLSDIVMGVICGFGPDSYLLALRGLAAKIEGPA